MILILMTGLCAGCGKEGVKKGARDPYRGVDLLHRGVLDPLLGHQLQGCGHQPAPDLFPLLL